MKNIKITILLVILAILSKGTNIYANNSKTDSGAICVRIIFPKSKSGNIATIPLKQNNPKVVYKNFKYEEKFKNNILYIKSKSGDMKRYTVNNLNSDNLQRSIDAIKDDLSKGIYIATYKENGTLISYRFKIPS
ncbi:hypothetical protein DRP43_01570 [candidate division TA06 bacterium]|uniref:Uncharacterized protein n=1 Tax=candidate division TA06 bacterium TaxID=2250710 RepID=A0A660SMY1_UNCT6|nr:MAG: hypothetical protein DRP43_01570 [candidate division TA06 bacterium]